MRNQLIARLLLVSCLCSTPGLAQIACGDCDDNGAVANILDALQGARIAAGLAVPTVDETCACDVNSSGGVDVLDERPLLLVVRRDGAKLTKQQMLSYFTGKVAKWWIPDDVVFVDELPHTATGKLLKTKLREDFKDHKLPSA